jgi:hypothetical protein
MRKRFEWLTFERRQDQDGDLIAGFGLVGFKVASE